MTETRNVHSCSDIGSIAMSLSYRFSGRLLKNREFVRRSSNAAQDRALEWSRAGFLSVLVHCVLLLNLALIFIRSDQDDHLLEPVLNAELLAEEVQEEPPPTVCLPPEIPETPVPVVSVPLPMEMAKPEIVDFPEVDTVPALDDLRKNGSRTNSEDHPGRGNNAMRPVDGVGSPEVDLTTGQGGWKRMLRRLNRHGLDIVIVFDSTGSMGGEIRQVKEQMRRIGETLLKLVPTTRISLCTYRDQGDAYVVKGLPMTNQLSMIDEFLSEIRASGGGDAPEAVEEGLRWAIENNRFRGGARKVILVFGDAPPHTKRFADCLNCAAGFRRRGGIVSTVTCRRRSHIPEFQQIARAGDGEAFLTTDQQQIMRALLVLVFGSKYQNEVLKEFNFTGKKTSSFHPKTRILSSNRRQNRSS